MKIIRRRSRQSMYVGENVYDITGLHPGDMRWLAHMLRLGKTQVNGMQGPRMVDRMVRILERAVDTGETLDVEYTSGLSNQAMCFQRVTPKNTYLSPGEQRQAGWQVLSLNCQMHSHAGCDGKVPGYTHGARCWCDCHDGPEGRPPQRTDADQG